jgi:hypothetical protein
MQLKKKKKRSELSYVIKLHTFLKKCFNFNFFFKTSLKYIIFLTFFIFLLIIIKYNTSSDLCFYAVDERLAVLKKVPIINDEVYLNNLIQPESIKPRNFFFDIRRKIVTYYDMSQHIGF